MFPGLPNILMQIPAFARTHWVALLTVLLGIVPLALLSLDSNSFWPSSPHQFPFLLSIPVVVGDGLFIPVFNLYLYRLLRASPITVRDRRLPFLFVTVVGVLLSFPLLYWIHDAWSKDPYTGFTDLYIGTLSVAGWWHVAFASLESSIVLVYIVTWVVLSRGNSIAFRIGLTGWKYFCGFVLLLIPDMILKLWTVYQGASFAAIAKTEWPIVPTLFLPFLILAVVYKKRK